MNEIAMLDKNLSVDRTPELIAVEINSIKEQTRKMVLFNSIEIGRRLAEAKLLIKHGEWGEWLSKFVDYSQRTASNLMAIFEQYGSSQITFFCDNAKSQALANLSYTQAVALLGIPQGEREAFVQEHDLDNMSTRELQQAIKEKQELEAKIMELEVAWGKDKNIADNSKRIAEEKTEEARKLLEEKQNVESDLRVTDKVLRDTQADVKRLQDALAKEKEESKDEIERLGLSINETKRLLSEAQTSGNNDEVERLSESLVKADSELVFAQQKIEELERQLKETPVEVSATTIVEKVPEAIEQELQRLRERTKELEAKGSQPINTAPIKFKLHFDALVKGFGDLLTVLNEIDADDRDKYKNAVAGLLGKMSERL